MPGKTALVFKLTGNFDFALASVLMDLRRVSPNLADDVIVFHDGLSYRSRKILEGITPLRFERYRFPIRSWKVRSARSVRQFTPLVFASFECLRLLDEFESVVQLDYDLVVQADLGELARSETGLVVHASKIPLRRMLLEEVDGYDLNVEGFGTLGFTRAIGDYRAMYDFCYSKLEETVARLWLPEMAIFGFMAQEFGLELDKRPLEVYSAHPDDAGPNAKILHSYALPKFWNGLHNAQWQSNYKAWLEAGGRPYREGRTAWRKLRARIFT